MSNQNVRLRDVEPGVLQPFNQAELKSVAASLKSLARDHPELAACLAESGPLRDMLTAALTLSPYLRDSVAMEADLLARALAEPLEPLLSHIVREARDAWKPDAAAMPLSDGVLMTRLRIAKRRLSLLTALADLFRLFDARQTTRWLSALADAAVAAAVDHLLLSGEQSGKLKIADHARPSHGSGLIALGMGKLGACELNYSSDIDIVIFFEPDAGILIDPEDGTETYSRLMRRLVRILQERTGDGYVFRTDLRLRPDPGSTPLAVPVEAALLYYEGRGQNWERAAFIKARPIAGDLAAGETFLGELRPFVFRKYLDYAAIADIHAIKRQIHAHKGHDAIKVKGHDIKLGRGGIREIEFFVQTQQLIAGGRMPALRVKGTEDGLKALNQANWIDDATTRELTVCYWFLRDVEHRLQMVRDEQTHLLPESDNELRRIALMLGFANSRAFAIELEAVLGTVEQRYGKLFEAEETLSGVAGNLVFTGQKDDPGTLKTLAALGFERPEDMSRIIRTWHNGRYRATHSVEARERLTAIMPNLLRIFGENRRADEALLRFDSFLKGLPAGIQLFSLLSNNPPLLELMVKVMAAAPRLADIIAGRPHVFDGMLDPALLVELPTRDYLAARLSAFLDPAGHYEEILDRLRIFAAEQRFLIGIRLLTGAITGGDAGRAFTDLAELVITATLDAVRREMDRAHGVFPGGEVALIGMGKLGSHELTAGSDVDLILLYDYDEQADASLGPRSLDATRYFTRLTQRLMAALSAPTAEGVLYEVDMRLRPSGNQGPVATRIGAFERYQREEAWTWEHMALTRARVVAGDAGLTARAETIIASVLATRRDPARLAADIREMRDLIEQEKPPRDIWDFKLIPGGLIDLEFIAQHLVLSAPRRGDIPDAKRLSTADRLSLLGPATIAPADLDLCQTALRLFSDVSQVIRLCIDGPFEPDTAPAGLIDLIIRSAGTRDLATLEEQVRDLSAAIRGIFDRSVRPPA
ncbi:bifunctional [glutamine synthetase] adenylyltransferase/[glutamine synthetase]-adenylyl-L-tyrosine phosphorylase [Rhizobium halophytocola]|uniref:Bifunctional glutamine synthetase adenylyltransferase/adenylyl-removing enzyme n=1 Tax=Rhizobium halophytocola TaxID=735519 RepID=A0ABS4DYX2_9HYPH|nr:bifunctional [glutamine synthetase] adenylyltransferase/[glutamine synthetase]-adenylyl-L-tyrosine phosphorylase [Rhizobium halophytocola]MBP1850882.1 glutamate-ammonia-ligase adenylyltransferase [Rhizobium halophytocola]